MHYYGVLRRISYDTFDFINASWLSTVEQYYNLNYLYKGTVADPGGGARGRAPPFQKNNKKIGRIFVQFL